MLLKWILAVNIFIQHFFVHLCEIFWDIYSEMKFSEWKVCALSLFLNVAKLLSTLHVLINGSVSNMTFQLFITSPNPGSITFFVYFIPLPIPFFLLTIFLFLSYSSFINHIILMKVKMYLAEVLVFIPNFYCL